MGIKIENPILDMPLHDVDFQDSEDTPLSAIDIAQAIHAMQHRW